MSGSPYETRPEQTAIAIGYTNREFVADQFLPRVRVSKDEFTYYELDKDKAFETTDDTAGRKARLNELGTSGELRTATCQDRGLTDVIPITDENEAADSPAVLRQINGRTASLMETVLLNREIRAAGLLQTPGNFADNIEADPIGTADSSLFKFLISQVEKLLMPATHLVMSRQLWSVVRTEASVVKAVQGNSGDEGAVTRQMLADRLELAGIVVGGALRKPTKRGKTFSVAPVYAPELAILRVETPVEADQVTTTWGFTAQKGERVAGSREEADIGLRGGRRVKAGESVGEVISSKLSGRRITGLMPAE